MPDKSPVAALDAPKTPKPDLTSVRTLITSVTALAQALGLSIGAIYRWIKVNRIASHVIDVCNFYNIEIHEILHLTGSELSTPSARLIKPKNTLAVLLEVYRGTKTLQDACEELGISLISGKLIMTHWGDELPTLYTTLTQLDEKRISLETAMQRLGVTKYTLHGIRAKYGFAPGAKRSSVYVKAKQKAAVEKREAQHEAALRVIAGTMTTQEAMDMTGDSYRTIFRRIERLTPFKLNELAAWPRSFRAALRVEIEKKMPNLAYKWFKFAQESRLFLRDNPKFPTTPETWKSLPLKRLMVGVLLGEASLAEIAASKGGDPFILGVLFTSDLQVLDLTWDAVEELPIAHQVALADLLLSVLDRKRKVVDPKSDVKEGAK